MSDMQQEAIAVLSEIWQLSPEVRLGQLMAHLDFLADAYLGKGLGYLDDDELLAVLYRHRSELKARLEGLPSESPKPNATFAAALAATASPANLAH